MYYKGPKTTIFLLVAIFAQIMSLFPEIGPIGISCSIFLLVSLLTSAMLSSKTVTKYEKNTIESVNDRSKQILNIPFTALKTRKKFNDSWRNSPPSMLPLLAKRAHRAWDG